MSHLSKFEKVIAKLFRPVLRLCVRNSVKLNELIDILKKELVLIAEEQLKAEGQKVSGSRISMMTGVHRKDISRFQSQQVSDKPKNIISKVMVQWQHNSNFTTKAGKPRVLNTVGRDSEFAQLVDSINGGNISSYSVLKEMERMGIVEKKGDRVKLLWRDYIPRLDKEDALELLASDTQDLFFAVEENIYESPNTANLHLKTVFDKVPARSLPEIRQWLITEGSLFHKKVRNYLSAFDADLNTNIEPSSANCKVTLGSFSLTQTVGRN